MNKGFSLVELIVVIAIMAILVGVAVPVYTGYITKANEASDIQAIDTLEHACKVVNIEYDIAIDFEAGASGAKAITATVSGSQKADAIKDLKAILGSEVTWEGDTCTLTLNTVPGTTATDKVKVPTDIA